MQRAGSPRKHFLDSGAFSLWAKAAQFGKEHNCSPKRFYRTKAFWKYMEGYVRFVKRYQYGIDFVANVDVLPFKPSDTWAIDLSRKHQTWLEEAGLKPIPVVHLYSPMSVLKSYIQDGHKLIGLGGLAGKGSREPKRAWINQCFRLVCNTPNQMPMVRLHGFGITSIPLLLDFPWYSVDSTSWAKVGGYGGIMVPRKRNSEFVFDCVPYMIKASLDSPDNLWGKAATHYLTARPSVKRLVEEWLDFIGIPLGTYQIKPDVMQQRRLAKGDFTVLKKGVLTHYAPRQKANLLFFEEMRKHIQKFPHPFRCASVFGEGMHLDPFNATAAPTFEEGIISNAIENPPQVKLKPESRKLVIFYSGESGRAAYPEVALQEKANLMLTYHNFHKHNRPDKRFQAILKARKRKAAK